MWSYTFKHYTFTSLLLDRSDNWAQTREVSGEDVVTISGYIPQVPGFVVFANPNCKGMDSFSAKRACWSNHRITGASVSNYKQRSSASCLPAWEEKPLCVTQSPACACASSRISYPGNCPHNIRFPAVPVKSKDLVWPARVQYHANTSKLSTNAERWNYTLNET